MFFVREIRYLYYYDGNKRICAAGTCKLRTQGDRLVMDLYLKKMHALYPIQAIVKLALKNTGIIGEEHVLIEEQKAEYHISFMCDKVSEERPRFYSFVFIGKDKMICDEETWSEYLCAQEEKKDIGQSLSEKDFAGNEGVVENLERREELIEKLREVIAKEETSKQKVQEIQMLEADYSKPEEIEAEETEPEVHEAVDPMIQQKDIIHIPDEKGIKQEYYVLKPEELVQFGQDFADFKDNSFLLHGYYNYHHIILGPVGKPDAARMRIGVPGNYYDREEMVAAMFDFISFVSVKGDRRTGAYGYYFTEEMF